MFVPSLCLQRRGEFVEKGLGVERREGRATRNQAGEEARDIRRGEAAATDFFNCAGKPCDNDILAWSNEFHEIAGAVAERAQGNITAARRDARRTSKVDSDGGGEMTGPFAFH